MNIKVANIEVEEYFNIPSLGVDVRAWYQGLMIEYTKRLGNSITSQCSEYKSKRICQYTESGGEGRVSGAADEIEIFRVVAE